METPQHIRVEGSHCFMLRQGVPLRVIQEILGHTPFSTTADIYAHVLPVLMADAVNRRDEALTGT